MCMCIAVYIFAQQSGTNILWLCVYVPFICFVCFVCASNKKCLNDHAYNCLIHFYSELIWKTTFDWRQPSMKDDLRWKTKIDGRQKSMENDLRWKRTFDGRRPLMEENLWGKTTFNRRRSSMEDELPRKTIFDGRQPSMEDNLWWKMPFDGRWPVLLILPVDVSWGCSFCSCSCYRGKTKSTMRL